MWLLLVPLALAQSASSVPDEASVAEPAQQMEVKIERGRPFKKAGKAIDDALASLVDLQNLFYEQLEAHTAQLGMKPGDGFRVEVSRDLKLRVEVVARDGSRADVRVRFESDPGPTRVILAEEGVPRELALDESGGVLIEGLEVDEAHQVQVFLADGEVLILWITPD